MVWKECLGTKERRREESQFESSFCQRTEEKRIYPESPVARNNPFHLGSSVKSHSASAVSVHQLQKEGQEGTEIRISFWTREDRLTRETSSVDRKRNSPHLLIDQFPPRKLWNERIDQPLDVVDRSLRHRVRRMNGVRTRNGEGDSSWRCSEGSLVV